jgi:S-layer family protein
MKVKFVLGVVPTLALGLLAAASAQEARMSDFPVGAPEGIIEDGSKFGTASLSVEQVFSWAFQTTRPDLDIIRDNGNGYRSYQVAGGAAIFYAAVHIPSGVEIDFIALNYCDNSANSLMLTMYDSFGDNQFNTVGTFVAPNRVGCGYAVSNELNYQYDANGGRLLSFYVFQTGGLDGSVSFRGAEVRYHRKVSPAPANASFPNDVPTNHPQFRFVEALAASGVTGGCGAGAFCPDTPVTRGQMAVFLAVALGLHFPN